MWSFQANENVVLDIYLTTEDNYFFKIILPFEKGEEVKDYNIVTLANG